MERSLHFSIGRGAKAPPFSLEKEERKRLEYKTTAGQRKKQGRGKNGKKIFGPLLLKNKNRKIGRTKKQFHFFI